MHPLLCVPKIYKELVEGPNVLIAPAFLSQPLINKSAPLLPGGRGVARVILTHCGKCQCPKVGGDRFVAAFVNLHFFFFVRKRIL